MNSVSRDGGTISGYMYNSLSMCSSRMYNMPVLYIIVILHGNALISAHVQISCVKM